MQFLMYFSSIVHLVNDNKKLLEHNPLLLTCILKIVTCILRKKFMHGGNEKFGVMLVIKMTKNPFEFKVAF